MATALLLEADGVAGIYIVSTAITYRRRGIAVQLTAAGLDTARRHGLQVAALQANEASRTVYQGLGFDTVGHFRLFTL